MSLGSKDKTFRNSELSIPSEVRNKTEETGKFMFDTMQSVLLLIFLAQRGYKNLTLKIRSGGETVGGKERGRKEAKCRSTGGQWPQNPCSPSFSFLAGVAYF